MSGYSGPSLRMAHVAYDSKTLPVLIALQLGVSAKISWAGWPVDWDSLVYFVGKGLVFDVLRMDTQSNLLLRPRAVHEPRA